jgi:hypothetical protein
MCEMLREDIDSVSPTHLRVAAEISGQKNWRKRDFAIYARDWHLILLSVQHSLHFWLLNSFVTLYPFAHVRAAHILLLIRDAMLVCVAEKKKSPCDISRAIREQNV